MGAIKSQFSAFSSKMGPIKSQFSAFGSKMGAYQITVFSIGSKMGAIETQFSAFGSKMGAYQNHSFQHWQQNDSFQSSISLYIWQKKGGYQTKVFCIGSKESSIKQKFSALAAKRALSNKSFLHWQQIGLLYLYHDHHFMDNPGTCDRSS
jgi:hypothetical protein